MTYRPGIVQIAIHGQNDEKIIVHGEGAGTSGVYLAEDGVDTLLAHAPEKQTWKSGARSKGSRPKNRKILHKDIDLTFLVMETDVTPYEVNDSYLEQAIGYELDPYDDDAKYAKIALTTDISGTRFMDIVQYEEADFVPSIDPQFQEFGETTLKVRSGDPDWYEPDWVSSCEFDSSGEGYVEVWNPTPRDMHLYWVCTLGTWDIPDFSWKGKKGHRYPAGRDEARFIRTPAITSTHGGLRINATDRNKLMAEDFNDTNILALFNGQHFIHKIPAYTQRQRIPVYFTDSQSVGEGRIELRQPRRWPRAYGGELRA